MENCFFDVGCKFLSRRCPLSALFPILQSSSVEPSLALALLNRPSLYNWQDEWSCGVRSYATSLPVRAMKVPWTHFTGESSDKSFLWTLPSFLSISHLGLRSRRRVVMLMRNISWFLLLDHPNLRGLFRFQPDALSSRTRYFISMPFNYNCIYF